MRKKVSLILLIILTLSFSIFTVGCTKENNSLIYNFDISESFELINSNVNENNVQLVISGDSEINEYMLLLKDNFKHKNLDFEIYVYDTSETNFNLNASDFQNLRMKINFNTNNGYYTQDKYVIIPNMDSNKKVLPFKNESVEIIDNVLTCKIEVDEDNSIEDILSTAKIYSQQVKELNTEVTGVKIIVNNKYKYESSDYLVLMETINLL